MEKRYEHQNVENEITALWEKKEYFKGKVDDNKKPFTILLPPPNANGRLHVGHVLMLAIEDLLIRWKRMQGFSTLWVPGTDHAGFETQVVFERELEKNGKSRFDYDRETLYKMIWDFVEDNSGQIIEQTKAMGPSIDWSRNTFMLEDRVVDIVLNTFEKMSKDDLIYRDNYIVNYCTHHQTTLSDLELDREDQKTDLYFIKYPLVDRKEGEPEHVVVATTRPEPIFIDTHLAVNPKDDKNKWLLGRKVKNPLTDVEMEFVEDPFVDPEFGTGIVKLTPAHDKNDYEAAVKHKLPIRPAFSTDGKIVSEGGELAGLSIKDARKKALEIIESKGLLEKVDEKYVNTISKCYKCGTQIEPLVIPNWFVKVGPLKKPAHDAVKNGDVKIYPKWQESKYHRWMEDMRDWPVSRQIVWGIRIPAWYQVEENPNIIVTFLHNNKSVTGTLGGLLKEHSLEDIEAGLQSLIAPNDAKYKISKEKPGKDYIQETDTFDTWFSSGQWPLTTLGYPDSKDFKYFYPTSVMETGWEILRFWVSRMMMFGTYLTGKPPFKDVYLHGLVRAEDGKKMSKSLGNVVDPLEVVQEFGADATRMGLISGTAGGKDFNYPADKVKAYRNFANKIWNMARFILMMIEREGGVFDFGEVTEKTSEKDKEVLEKLNKTAKIVTSDIKKYRFGQAGETIYHFMWDDLASDYLESIKSREAEDKKVALTVLVKVFSDSLKLLHPFMPFVTEAIWQEIKKEDDPDLVVSNWPVHKD